MSKMIQHLLGLLALMVICQLEVAAACQRSCGDMEVPYPFGLLGDPADCYFNESYAINCSRNSNDDHAVAYLNGTNIDISSISVVDHALRKTMYVSRDCYTSSGDNSDHNTPSIQIPFFPISNTKNKFIALGCDTYAVLSKATHFIYGDDYKTGCLTTCTGLNSVVNGSCSGVGCCQTSIPKNAYSYKITVSSYNNHSDVIDFNKCSYAFVAANDSFLFSTGYLSNFNDERVPLVLDWSVGNGTCEQAKMNMTSYMCKGNHTTCSDADNGTGYRCRCKNGYQGNPYLSGDRGCLDINECNDTINFPCAENASCENKDGGFSCSCLQGYIGDGMKNGSKCTPKPSSTGGKKSIGLVVGITIPSLLLLCSWVYWGLRQRKILMQREKFFQQNGGLMLQKLLVEHRGSVETTTIFTDGELRKATNNYHESTILGQGGHGIVYKGKLDNKTIAIKKSKFVDQTQVKEFINEVVILTQINHKNVVKLIGCCLEKEVPLLVYEFITNGTLFDHIHKAGHHPHMSWKSRLRIAAETAGALSYLHSDANTQIIHGDIKTANILLDDNFTSKVSDFGASKLVVVDQTQISMLVQGTLGYLDPEYFNRMELSDKSDVYSFGVVLAELLTGMKALSFARPEKQKSLSMYFVSKYQEGNLLEIIDERILQDQFVKEIMEVAKLATRCLQMRGVERPSMKEVSMELEGLIRAMEMHPWAEGNHDENEHLLTDKVSECGEVSIGNSMAYDSIKNQVVFQIGSGR